MLQQPAALGAVVLFLLLAALVPVSHQREAWTPQGRFGKRSLSSAGGLNEFGGPKRAWIPQSRFGKRSVRSSPDDEELALAGVAGSYEGDEDVEKRAWQPQGRFGKRLSEEQRNAVLESLRGELEKRAWQPQGRFGKRTQFDEGEVRLNVDKKAWQPQGRFGKRYQADSDENEAMYDESHFLDKKAWQPQGRFGKRHMDDDEDALVEGLGQDMSLSTENSKEKKAWQPQGRFGKRHMDQDEDQLLEGGYSSEHGVAPEKKAWQPQGRFGKRREEGVDGHKQALLDTLTSLSGENPKEKKAWQPQGRFGKRTQYDEGEVAAMNVDKKAWTPQGRFGKRQPESSSEEQQKRAWTPQGRFGKRQEEENELMEDEDEEGLTAAKRWWWSPGQRTDKRHRWSDLLHGGPKRAWRPSGRFGKREARSSLQQATRV